MAIAVGAAPVFIEVHAAERAPSTVSAGAELLPAKESAQACHAAADQLAQHGHRREAIVLYERARQQDPRRKQVCRILAVLYDLEKQDKKALAEYRKALEREPNDPDLLNDFGCYYLRRYDYAAAEKHFRAAVDQAPDHERAWTNLGMALGAQGRFQASFEAFAQAVGPAAAHSNVGMLLAKNGHWNDAGRAFENALRMDPDLPQARVALSVVERTLAKK
jgi:Tfp pilus assembly protein PilF